MSLYVLVNILESNVSVNKPIFTEHKIFYLLKQKLKKLCDGGGYRQSTESLFTFQYMSICWFCSFLKINNLDENAFQLFINSIQFVKSEKAITTKENPFC